MIDSLTILVRNFQSLRNASIVVEGLTVVTGPSDIGKSALVRAVEAALFHRSGDSFVTTGEMCAEVHIAKKGDFSIVWRKGWKEGRGTKLESINEFIVNGSPLKKVGRSQPTEVADLGFRIIDYDGLKIPLQIRRQRGVAMTGRTYAPFIIGFSTSEAEKVLARIVQSDEYSIASRQSAKDRQRNRERLNLIDEELASAVERLHNYKPLGQLREDVDSLSSTASTLRDEATSLVEVKELHHELGDRQLVPDLVDLPDRMEEPSKYLEVATLAVELAGRKEVPSMSEVPSIDISLDEFAEVKKLAADLWLLRQHASDDKFDLELKDEELDTLAEELDEFKVCPLCDSVLVEGVA